MKCGQCKKKITMDFDCKCSKKFCLDCLPFDRHNCSFDYHQNKRENLTKTVIGAKHIKVDDI